MLFKLWKRHSMTVSLLLCCETMVSYVVLLHLWWHFSLLHPSLFCISAGGPSGARHGYPALPGALWEHTYDHLAWDRLCLQRPPYGKWEKMHNYSSPILLPSNFRIRATECFHRINQSSFFLDRSSRNLFSSCSRSVYSSTYTSLRIEQRLKCYAWRNAERFFFRLF